MLSVPSNFCDYCLAFFTFPTTSCCYWLLAAVAIILEGTLSSPLYHFPMIQLTDVHLACGGHVDDVVL